MKLEEMFKRMEMLAEQLGAKLTFCGKISQLRWTVLDTIRVSNCVPTGEWFGDDTDPIDIAIDSLRTNNARSTRVTFESGLAHFVHLDLLVLNNVITVTIRLDGVSDEHLTWKIRRGEDESDDSLRADFLKLSLLKK